MALTWWRIAQLFRQKANECRKLALATESDDRREWYVELASMWEALAAEARRRHSLGRDRPTGADD
jgi:hypothetical protein